VVYLQGAKRGALHSRQALVGEVVCGQEFVVSVVVAVVMVVPAPGLATGLVELVKLIRLWEAV